MSVLCLCQEDHQQKLIPGYATAFRARGVPFYCVDWSPPFDASLQDLLGRCAERPSWILHFESAFPLLPVGLEQSGIPTICFQMDTFAYTHRRIRWSYLFDQVAVFHPGYDARFQEAGHRGAFLLPHSVQREFFDLPELPRDFEVGWVGRTHGALYRRRRKLLPRLARSFRMNEWERTYTQPEMAEVYRRSRVVVNIGRNDYPQDANLRTFEALAAGALLITSVPSELVDLGFTEGVHFVGYRQEKDLFGLVARCLADETSRRRIADAGREKVLREYTYDRRVAQLMERFERFQEEALAPARSWPRSRVELAYLDFFAAEGALGCAAGRLRRIGINDLKGTLKGVVLLSRAWLKAA